MTLPLTKSRNDGFRPLPTDTEASMLKQIQRSSPRRFSLGWISLVAIVTGAALVGVVATLQLHCNPAHPTLIGSSGMHPMESTAVKLNVNTKIPDILPTTGAWPKVAWLMSFPNSGTSFTSQMIRHYSKMSTASNYGEEYTDEDGQSIPIYPNSTTGPFWIDSEYVTGRPTIYALTKTHCGGRCEKCGPSAYVENPHSFLMQCLSGKRAVVKNNTVTKEFVDMYDVELVQKAVHLIRSPFDNVVSRFHLERHNFVQDQDEKKLKLYPSSSQGFRKFCLRLNKEFEREETHSRLMDPNAWALMKDVPCRDDFFRFVQWHNLAIITTASLKIPTLVIHYEKYETSYNETAMELMEFLHLEPTGELIDFYKGKEYDDFFTTEERSRVKQAMKIMALSWTWDQISRYFD